MTTAKRDRQVLSQAHTNQQPGQAASFKLPVRGPSDCTVRRVLFAHGRPRIQPLASHIPKPTKMILEHHRVWHKTKTKNQIPSGTEIKWNQKAIVE